MKKNIMVTGASGFIGKKLTSKLKEKKFNVIELNSKFGDISSCVIKKTNIDHVFHLAAKTFVPLSWENPKEYYNVNVMGTANILDFCQRNKCSLTFVSTYVYGIPNYLPINEEHPLNPNTPYNHGKVLAEEICKFYAQNFNTQVTILRPFNIYGPNQKDDFLIPKIINQVLDKNRKIIEVFDLAPKRDYLYIDDFIEALILTIENNKFSIYNIGSGYSVSVEEVIKSALNAANISKKYCDQKLERKNEVMDVVADIKKIQEELNWKPKYTFAQGIKKIVDSILINN